jgi:hypothetical protein
MPAPSLNSPTYADLYACHVRRLTVPVRSVSTLADVIGVGQRPTATTSRLAT